MPHLVDDQEMSINYRLFEFACPPRTGTCWFLKASQLAGLGTGFGRQARVPFAKENDGSVLQVSLVRNPCDWLRSCWCGVTTGRIDRRRLGFVAGLDFGSFDGFVRSYLEGQRPGAVGRLYDGYEADVRLRIEDMPWACIELFDSLGVPGELRYLIKRLKPQRVSANPPACSNDLRRRILESEKELCRDCDYF